MLPEWPLSVRSQPRDRLLLAALAILASLLVASCSASPATSDAPSEPTSSATLGEPGGIDQLRFTCGRFPFGADVLAAPARNDEAAPNPMAEALRRHLAMPGPDIDFLPDAGWTLVGVDGSAAEFVAVGADLTMTVVFVSNDGAGWKTSGWGGCQPEVILGAGLGAAEWTWGGPGVPGPDTQVFDALVTERACASGKSADGRGVGPAIVKSGDTVLVIFAVRPLGGEFQTCPSNPSSRVTVDLGEPLGDRRLLDGGRLPFADPTQPRD